MANIYYKNGSSWINMANIFYPVGAYYLANVSTSPSNLFGGTWQQVSDSRFLCASTSAGGNGGENRHALTVAEMPSHRHYIDYKVASWSSSAGSAYTYLMSKVESGAWDAATEYTGSGNSHNNMPLYRTCYCWYRTA